MYLHILRCIVISTGFLLHICISNGQWKAVYKKDVILQKEYCIRQDSSSLNFFKFRFPEYSAYDHFGVLHDAYNCQPRQIDREEPNTPKPFPYLVFEKDFKTIIPIKKDTTNLQIRVFTKNVSAYKIKVYNDITRSWHVHEIKTESDGYQKPVIIDLGRMLFEGEIGNVKEITPMNGISKLLIQAMPLESDNNFQFIIGDLAIVDKVSVTKNAKHNLFYFLGNEKLINHDSVEIREETKYQNETCEFLYTPPLEFSQNVIPSRISVMPEIIETDSIGEKDIFKKLIKSAISNYQYSNEHKIKIKKINKDLEQMFANSNDKDFCGFAYLISNYLEQKFNDLHFYISYQPKSNCYKPDSKRKKSPIRIEEIGGKFIVVANFDSANFKVPLNSEILLLDNVPISKVIDSVAKERFDLTNLNFIKRHLIISELLDRSENDSCKLTFKISTKSHKLNETIKYNIPYVIPKSFRAIHGEIRKLRNDILYYRLNNWDESAYLTLINHWNMVSKAKSLIIDLRGNGGGELSAAVQFFSVFINRPTTCFSFVSGEGTLEPVMVRPDAEYNFPPSKKIIILGDKFTACTSEAFIKAMQINVGAKFISFSSTAGSLSGKYDILLPSGIVIHINSIQRKISFTSSKDIVEGRGINSDYKIAFSNVYDLRPYNDKLLSEAIKIVSADIRD